MSSYTPTSPIESPPRRLTFSLRTMFFIITCAAVFFAGSRAGKTEAERIVFGATLFMAFLTIWSVIRGWNGIPWKISVTLSLFLLATLVAANRPRINARQAACENNLRQIGQALILYDARHGHLPHAFAAAADGKPLFSWRGTLLTEIGRADLAASLLADNLRSTEPWNGVQNLRISKAWLALYQCPSDAQAGNPMSNYLAITGSRTAWPTTTPSAPPQYVSLGYIARHKGLNNTILLIEIPNSNINWLEPRDVTIDQLKNGLAGLIPPGASSPHPEGFSVLFADGHVETLPADIDPKKLIEMCNIDGSSDGGSQ
jgi:prepilin-type processing-associated H-X9-DG protein